MPSPILPSDFCSLAPTPTTVPCDAIKRIFFDYPNMLCEFLGWMLNEDGTISEEFKKALGLVPAGLQRWFAGVTVPAGHLYCNGAAYKQADYPDLYAAIGTIFGSGNGVDEFQVPNLGRRFMLGSSTTTPVATTGGEETATLLRANLPNEKIEIGVEVGGIDGDEEEGRMRVGDGNITYQPTTLTDNYGETRPLGDGTPFSIMSPYIVMTPCIKT